MKVAGLFAGIGGIELGLHRAGFSTELLCEVDPGAMAVLGARFPEVPLVPDVTQLRSLPQGVDVVAAGFPCQDLSQAGRTAGIMGAQSGLVEHVFRLVSSPKASPTWLFLENVPFMLQLDQGRAMHFLTESLEALGFAWAYRVVDTRAFGLPHRRQRVMFLASRSDDPRPVLFGEDAGEAPESDFRTTANGFYWTEGLRGLGWAVDAVPTLKAGSTVGIPSPPAVWFPSGEIRTPDLRDAERLQGFPEDWTRAANELPKGERHRWKLVGNAVSTPVAQWVGERLMAGGSAPDDSEMLVAGRPWPKAAWGRDGKAFGARVSLWPRQTPRQHLAQFLQFEGRPLSIRAARGFLSRAERGQLRFPEGLLDAVRAQAASVA